MPRPPYGYCPHCGSAGIGEKNGIIHCRNGHQYTLEEAENSPNTSTSVPQESTQRVKVRGWGDKTVPLEETNPRQKAAPVTSTPQVMGDAVAPHQPPPPSNIGGGEVPPGSFIEYATKMEEKQAYLENRLRNVAALLHSVLGEFEGYLPENAVKREENSLKVEKPRTRLSQAEENQTEELEGDIGGPSNSELEELDFSGEEV